MNRTDQFSDEELLQAIGNFDGVLRVLIPMRDALRVRDKMFKHFAEVIEFLKDRKKETTKLLTAEK